MKRKAKRKHSAVRNIATYNIPIFALYKGKVVTLTATGDRVGDSPVEKIVDGDGHFYWVPQTDIKVIDPRLRTNLDEIFQK